MENGSREFKIAIDLMNQVNPLKWQKTRDLKETAAKKSQTKQYTCELGIVAGHYPHLAPCLAKFHKEDLYKQMRDYKSMKNMGLLPEPTDKPADTGKPTAEPEVTVKPVATDKTEVTGKPEKTKKNEKTKKPDKTEKSDKTGKPEKTDESEIYVEPVVTDKPKITDPKSKIEKNGKSTKNPRHTGLENKSEEFSSNYRGIPQFQGSEDGFLSKRRSSHRPATVPVKAPGKPFGFQPITYGFLHSLRINAERAAKKPQAA